MSANKKNNKKNRRNNYKIEALEPRLMMDAEVSQWEAEDSSFTSINPGNIKTWLNYSLENVAQKDSATGSLEHILVQDALESEIEVASIDSEFNEIMKKVKRKFSNAVSDLREDLVKKYKENHDVDDDKANEAVDSMSLSANQIVNKIGSISNVEGWSITCHALSAESVAFTVKKSGTNVVDDLQGIVTEKSNLSVEIFDRNSFGLTKGEDNVRYRASFDIVFDINSNEYLKNEDYQVETLFHELPWLARPATYGGIVLGCWADSDPTAEFDNPDYTIGIRHVNGKKEFVETADFDFVLSSITPGAVCRFGGDFASIYGKALKYELVGGQWRWRDATDSDPNSANNIVINKVMNYLANADIGLIVSKLSALSKWMSDCQYVTENNLEPLFKNDMNGLLSQNLSENINLSSMLGQILGQNISSLNQLSMFIEGDKTIDLDMAKGILVIPFNLKFKTPDSLNFSKSYVSLITDQIEEMGFAVQSNLPLDCESTASLDFNLIVNLKLPITAKGSHSAGDIGIQDSNLTGTVVVAPGKIGFEEKFHNDGSFIVEKGSTSVEVNFAANKSYKDVLNAANAFKNCVYYDQTRGLIALYDVSNPFKLCGHDAVQSARLSELGLLNVSSTKRGCVLKIDINKLDKTESLDFTLKVGDKEYPFEDFYCEENLDDLASALMSVIASNEDLVSKKIYVQAISEGGSDYLFISEGSVDELECDGDSLIQGSVIDAYVAISGQLGIEKVSSDVEITFELNVSGTSKIETIKIGQDKLSVTKNVSEIAQVINEVLASQMLDKEIEAFVCDGRLGFKPLNSSTLKVSFNQDAFGFRGKKQYNETSECIEIKVKNLGTKKIETQTINLVGYQIKGKKLTAANSLDEILNAIVERANSAFGVNCLQYDKGKIVALNDYVIDSIKDINGFTLAAMLGITGDSEDNSEFGLNAILDSARKNAVSFGAGSKLTVTQKVYGDIEMDATLGGVAVEIGKEKFSANNTLVVEFGGQLPDIHILMQKALIERESAKVNEALNAFDEFLNKASLNTSLTLQEVKDSVDAFCNVCNDYNKLLMSFVTVCNDINCSSLTVTATNALDAVTDLMSSWSLLKKQISNIINDNINKVLTDYNQALKDCVVNISSITKPTLDFNVKDSALSLGSLDLNTSTWTASKAEEKKLESLKNFELHDVFSAISYKIYNDVSTKLQSLQVCDFSIPFVGKSFSDVFGIYAKIKDIENKFASVSENTYQEFFDSIKKRLGVDITLDLEFNQKNQVMTFNLFWKKEIVNQKIELGDLAPSYFPEDSINCFFGGAFEAYINGSVTFNMNFVVTKSGDKYVVSIQKVKDKDLVECHFDITSDLAGDFSVCLNKKTSSMLKVVNGNGDKKSQLHLFASNSLNFDKSGNLALTKGNLDVGGLIKLQALGCDVGNICIGADGGAEVSVDLTKIGKNYWEIFEVLSPEIPSSTYATSTYTGKKIVFNLNGMTADLSTQVLFDKLTMVANGLGEVLRKAQSGLNRGLLRDSFRNIPLLGDRIISAADCLTCLDEELVDPFRKFVNKAEGLDAKSVAQTLYELLESKLAIATGVSASSFSEDWAGKTFNQIYKNGIKYYETVKNGEIVEVGWYFTLKDSYDLDKNADFDLGFPGLSLKSEGKLKLDLTWELDIGFGISLTDGAFLLLSDGSEKSTDTFAGDDLRIQITPTWTSNALDGKGKLKGTLGFLDMEASIGSLPVLDIGVDLNDGSNNSVESKDRDGVSDKGKSSIAFTGIGSGINVDVNAADAKINFDLDLLLTAGKEFPSITTNFVFDWEMGFGNVSADGLKTVAFNNTVFNAGEFLTKMVKPVVQKIKMVLDPIQPLIDFLQSEIPVLNKLPAGKIKITVLDLIKMYGNTKGMKLEFLDDVISLNNIIKNFNFSSDLGFVLPNLVLFDESRGPGSNANVFAQNFLNGSVSNLDAWLDDIIGATGIGSSLINVAQVYDSIKGWDTSSLTALSSSSLSGVTNLFGDDSIQDKAGTEAYGWSFPILSEPLKNVLGLMFGNHANLITYNMRPLEFKFDWGKSFPIVGPLCADISFNFGACIDLSFGYDTLGLINWKKSDFKNASALLDGFYIGDWDANGRDVSEVVFHSGIAAGASVASIAGINVALDLDVNMNFNDPNNDGKIRYFELIENFKNSPLNIFDYSASIEVEAYAYLKYLFGKKKWTLWSSGAMSLFDTASKQGSKTVLLSVENDDTYVNIGRYAQKRNVGNLSDGDDYVDITCSSDSATVSWGESRLATGEVDAIATETRKVKGTLYIYAENGKDDIKITSEEEINYNIVIYGDDGDDRIDLSGLKFADGYYAIIEGGAGDDYIAGALAGTNVIFGEEGRYKESAVANKKKLEMVEAYPDASRGNNVIIGGKDAKNYIFGGGGNDHIVGGDTVAKTENYLFGDGGQIVFDGYKILRYDLFDEGGEDVIYGGIGDDFIYGGAGTDYIDGGAGKDEIHAGKGNDVVYGGSDNDEIHGDDGVDIIFGDRPSDPNMKIVAKDDISTVLPYFYVSDELKGEKLDATVELKPFQKPSKYENEFNNVVANRKVITPAKTLEDGTEVPADVKAVFNDLKNLQNGVDTIHGGFGSDIIFGDDGVNGAASTGKTDYLYGDADNDFIDGDGGNDEIYGDSGADVIYGGQGNDTIDGGADNDIVFGDDGWQGFADTEKGSSANSLYKTSDDLESAESESQEQENVFGYGISSFAKNFEIFSDAKSNVQGGNDTIVAGNGSDIVDGQSGDDTYIVNMKGEANLGYTTVLETGSDASDVLKVNGTSGNDNLLVRASNKGLGSVSLVPEQKAEYTDAEKSKIERVNFWKNAGVENAGIENLSLNAGAGNDTIAVDGTLSTLSIDAGAGNDNIMVGQLFKSARQNTAEANVADLDVFSTTPTSQGFVSNGVQHATSIEGGAGNDTFTLLHTSAALSLIGGTGNDTFNIQSLQRVDAKGDLAGIVMNGPVSVVGGVGHDTLNLAGSDGNDDFVITEDGMQSSGVSVQSVSIEQNNVSGGAGDDSFYVLSSKENVAYYIEGNEGNDSFYNGGVQTDEKYIQVENMDYRGHNGIIEHSVTTDVEAYKGIAADSISVNVIDYDASANNVLFVNSAGQIFEPSCQITEGAGASFLYKVCLSRQPAAGETVYVTVFVPSVTVETENRGGKGVLLAQASNATSWSSSTIVKLTAKNWKTGVSIWAKAESDSLREGSDYVAVLHKVETSNPSDKVNTCRNVLVFVNDNKSTAIDAAKPFVDADKNLQAGLTVENESVLQLKYTMTEASAKNATLQVYEDKSAKVLRMTIYSLQSDHIQNLMKKGTLNEKYYVIAGNQIVIRDPKGRAQSINGYVKFSNTIEFESVEDEKFVTSATAPVSGANMAVGQVVIEHTDGSTDVMEPKDKNSAPDYTDYYTISLAGPALTGSQTVDVAITPIATPYEYGSSKTMQQVEVYRITDENGNDLVDAEGNLITTFDKVTFTAANFVNGKCTKYRVYVRALADNVHESDALTLIAIGRNTIENIKGAVYEDGAGVGIDIDVDNPLMIHYGTKSTTEKTTHVSGSDNGTTDERNSASAFFRTIAKAAETRRASVDESKSVDRIFVNNMDNSFNAASSTKALKDDMNARNGNTYQDDLADNDEKLRNSDSESIRFNHTDRIHTDEANDLKKNISFGNMEYGEINLGTGEDTVDISKSIYRKDGFQTFTVVNSGKGIDTVNVNSYKDGSDDQLVINAGEGDDHVFATNENVKKKGLIVFGGLGDDEIEIKSESSVVFGDRGQVLYHDAKGNVVTRLGDDKTGTFIGKENGVARNAGGSDYATGKKKGDEAYYQTDGTRYGASIARTVTEDQGGNDTITLGGGRNVVFGGENKNEVIDKDEKLVVSKYGIDNITTGNGDDFILGDNGYTTFQGRSDVAKGLDMENMPTVYEESTISFNFQGDAQNGFEANDSVGAPGYESTNWVNIKGSLASTYGNDDSEIVRFDNGTRASAISLSYNGNEDLRFSSSDNAINLQTYNHWLSNRDQDNAAKLMNSGLMSTAPNNQNGNKVNVAIDGLAQYYESYKVVVYLDLPDANSWDHQSVRIVSLFIDGKREQAYYVNDPAPENFKGSFENHAVRAILNSDGSIKGVKRIKDKDGVEVETVEPIDDEFGRAMLYSNYVVFDVGANIASDRIVIRVEDGIQDPNYNGKDIPGIAAIQIKGVHHKQDVAATTNIDFGGRDVIHSGRGDDIVAGGTDADTIETFGDDHRGIDDNDIVFGDNAKMVFVDRDNNVETASMISSAESIAVKNLGVSYNDVIDTGDGNDTVVGGVGQDTIHSGATAAAEDMQDGVKALSINFTRDDADDSMKIREATYETKIVEGEVKFVYDGHGKKVIKTSGETAGVVADNDWHNMYVKNRELHEFADYSSHTVDGVDVAISSYANPWQEYWADNASMTNNISDELDGDTSNSKLYHNYLAAQKQEEIKLTLDHLDTFRSHNGLKSGAYCDLYVYLGGDNNDVHIYDHIYDISLTWYDKSGNKCKTEHRFLNDWTGYNFDGDYKEAYCTSYTEAVDMLHKDSAVCVRIIGNYVVFHNISVDKVDVRIKNVYTHTRGNQNPNENGEQNPKNLPLINAVQIVAGSGKEDAAIGGDHDKDLVFGDDAKLTFDIDVPYAVDEKMADYKNRVVEAESVAIADNVVKKLSTDDIIDTGKDRDVVVGGEGSDNITTGSGDDIAIGGSANLMVEHNNPLGVFTPSVEIVLDQHTIDTNNHQGYLDHHCNNPQEAEQVVRDFQGMLDQGQIKGIQIIDNKNDRLNTFDLGEGRDLQSTGSNDPSELVNQNDDEEQNGNQGSENPVINEDDQIDYDKTVISPVACAQLNLVANEKVKLVLESYPKSDDYTPNLWVFVSPQVPGQSFEDVCIELYSDGKLFSYDIEGGFWKSQDVPDHIDGDPTFKDGNCVVYVSSKVNTNVTVQVAEGG